MQEKLNISICIYAYETDFERHTLNRLIAIKSEEKTDWEGEEGTRGNFNLSILLEFLTVSMHSLHA